jgi:DNA polymerase III delta prime subunit
MIWIKKILISLAILLIPMAMMNCKKNEKQANTASVETQVSDKSKVKIYYFHGKQRCKTCVTIQKIAEEAFKENFAENNEVAFIEVDFSDRANTVLADKYEISFSSLVIATATDHIDLTELAFSNALSNPDLLKQKVIENTNKYLKQN